MYNFILIFTFLFLNTHAINDGIVIHFKDLISVHKIDQTRENWVMLWGLNWDSASTRFQPKFEKAYA